MLMAMNRMKKLDKNNNAMYMVLMTFYIFGKNTQLFI